MRSTIFLDMVKRKKRKRRKKVSKYPEAVRAYWREKMRKYRDKFRVRPYKPRPKARAVYKKRVKRKRKS